MDETKNNYKKSLEMNDNLEKIYQLISEANITIQRLKDVTATGYRRKQSNIKQPVK